MAEMSVFKTLKLDIYHKLTTFHILILLARFHNTCYVLCGHDSYETTIVCFIQTKIVYLKKITKILKLYTEISNVCDIYLFRIYIYLVFPTSVHVNTAQDLSANLTHEVHMHENIFLSCNVTLVCARVVFVRPVF